MSPEAQAALREKLDIEAAGEARRARGDRLFETMRSTAMSSWLSENEAELHAVELMDWTVFGRSDDEQQRMDVKHGGPDVQHRNYHGEESQGPSSGAALIGCRGERDDIADDVGHDVRVPVSRIRECCIVARESIPEYPPDCTERNDASDRGANADIRWPAVPE